MTQRDYPRINGIVVCPLCTSTSCRCSREKLQKRIYELERHCDEWRIALNAVLAKKEKR